LKLFANRALLALIKFLFCFIKKGMVFKPSLDFKLS
jgi:hypothetical protein